jgi:hypothetical protein
VLKEKVEEAMRMKLGWVGIGVAWLVLHAQAADQPLIPVWLDVETARREVEGFELMGEFVHVPTHQAVQAALLSDGHFLVAQYQGGLPGDGWDGSPIKSEKLTADALRKRLVGFSPVQRKSWTLGMTAPENAELLFPADVAPVKDGYLQVGGKTTKELGSFFMHLEFMLPLKPGRDPSNQDRGNSGIYIFNNYEVQVIDSFALDLATQNNAIPIESKNTQWCGALYKMKPTALNMSFPPLQWQSYDILFTAPVFEGDEKVKNGRITVYHNGVKIHDDVELFSGTGMGAKRKQLARGPVFFQDHGNPVLFRNIWAVEL